jgi:hypothetical protein
VTDLFPLVPLLLVTIGGLTASRRLDHDTFLVLLYLLGFIDLATSRLIGSGLGNCDGNFSLLKHCTSSWLCQIPGKTMLRSEILRFLSSFCTASSASVEELHTAKA